MITSFLSHIYKGLTDLRSGLYKDGVLGSQKVNIPVVSVGNITAGGTGKTPVVDFLVNEFREYGLKAGIVSRGYKGDYKGVVKVDPSSKNPKRFGDEPLLLSMKNPLTPVYLGKDRVKACESLLAEDEVDLIIADDAYQHLKLQRDLNVLLIDATEDLNNYELLPSGRARESFQAVERADIIFITKANWCDDLHLQRVMKFVLERIKEYEMDTPPIYVFDFKIAEICRFSESHKGEIGAWMPEDLEKLKSEKLASLCAIARPDTYQQSLVEMGLVVAKSFAFKDHYYYTDRDLRRIESECQALGIRKIVVTEKDIVKLLKWEPKDLEVLVASVKLYPRSPLTELFKGFAKSNDLPISNSILDL